MDDYFTNKEPCPVNADGDYLESFDDQSLKRSLKAFGLFNGIFLLQLPGLLKT